MTDEEVQQVIKAVRSAVDEIHECDEHITSLVKKHEHLLYGNGKEGLVTIVDRLERAIEGAQDVGRALVSALVIAFVIGLIVLVVQAGLLK